MLIAADGMVSHGSWFVRVGQVLVLFKAPWNEPLFSERHGYVKRLQLPFGWRILARKVKPLLLDDEDADCC